MHKEQLITLLAPRTLDILAISVLKLKLCSFCLYTLKSKVVDDELDTLILSLKEKYHGR